MAGRASLICGRSLFARLLLAGTRSRLDDVHDPGLAKRTHALADGLGVLAPVALKQSEGLGAPITFGLFRPTVVLPPHFDSEYTETEQDVVLAHELAHVANRDALWQLISEFTCALLWWHPFSWYARQQLQVESEFAADDATTLIHRGPETLAECLVELATRLSRRPRLGLLPVRGRGFRSSLGRRVERLVRLESSARPPRPGLDHRSHASRFAALTCSLAVVATITLTTAWARTPQSQTGALDMSTTRTPGIWRRSVAGFVFASLFTLSSGDASAQSTPNPVPDDTPIVKKTTRKSPSRDTGLSDDLFDDETAKPKVKKTRTPADPRPVGDDLLDDQTTKPRVKKRPLAPVVSPTPGQPPRPGVSTSRSFPTAPRASSGAIYDRGTGLFLDLVNLATTLTDAQGEVELQQIDYRRFEELSGQNLVPEHEILKAKILLETAHRKADILQRMAEAALNSSTNLLKQLRMEYELESQRVRVGAAPQAGLASIATRLAAAEGNVDILKTLLSSRRRPSSTRTGRTASAIRPVPTSLRIGVDRDGKLTLDGKRTDLESLCKTLRAIVPTKARAACKISLELESNCPLQKVTAVLARLENLEFSKVNLTTREQTRRLRESPGALR